MSPKKTCKEKKEREKERIRVASREERYQVDQVRRLDCCNFDVYCSKWWLKPWPVRGGRNPWNIDFSWLIYVQVQVGMPRYLLWEVEGSFTLFGITLWIMCSPLRGESTRHECLGGTSGVFDGLPHLWHDSCLSHEHSWASYAPREGMNASRPTCEYPHEYECFNTFLGRESAV